MCLWFQQTSDNAGKVKEIERRAQSLSGVLASPVSEEDYVEKGRRVVLRRFVLTRMNKYRFTYTSLRKLEGVVAKLEPFSEQQAFLRFLRNVDNAKTLAEFVQELADAITDYQVRATGAILGFDEHSSRFRYNKEYTRGQGVSTMKLRTSAMIPRTSFGAPRSSTMIPRIYW